MGGLENVECGVGYDRWHLTNVNGGAFGVHTEARQHHPAVLERDELSPNRKGIPKRLGK